MSCWLLAGAPVDRSLYVYHRPYIDLLFLTLLFCMYEFSSTVSQPQLCFFSFFSFFCIELQSTSCENWKYLSSRNRYKGRVGRKIYVTEKGRIEGIPTS